MQDSQEESAPVATNSKQQESGGKQQQSGGEADKASACYPVGSQDNNDVRDSPSVDQTPAPAQQTPQEKTPQTTENVLDYKVFFNNLNISGMGRRRSRLRFTKPPLSKWNEVGAAKGIQIFKGFDNLPPAKGLHSKASDEGNQPVKVVTAGTNFVDMHTFFVDIY